MNINIKLDVVPYIKIDEVPQGEVFIIGGSVYLKLNKAAFWDFKHEEMRTVIESRNDECARIVNAELVVTP